jgi:hypothetical protein
MVIKKYKKNKINKKCFPADGARVAGSIVRHRSVTDDDTNDSKSSRAGGILSKYVTCIIHITDIPVRYYI